VLSPPTVSWPTSPQTLYTIMLLNADISQAGLNPKLSRKTKFVHWLVVNIPGVSLELGTPVFRYIPSITYSFNSSSGLNRSESYKHTHMVLVFKQLRRVDVSKSSASQCTENIIKDR
jgi:hypothetical protein